MKPVLKSCTNLILFSIIFTAYRNESLLEVTSPAGERTNESRQSNPPSSPALPPLTVQPTPPAAKHENALPLIFLHDGAPDDIATMIYLTNHPDINVIGVIQSYGEQHPTRSLDDWQIFLYDILDYKNLPIGIGSVSPLDPSGNQFPGVWRAGADDFWGVPLPDASADYDHFNGTELLVHLIAHSPEQVTLLATGAQTDIALALQRNPASADHIAHIVIMGGAFNRPGNLGEGAEGENNSVAEWNIFVDALAAKQVFNAGIPLSVIPLDASDNLRIDRSDLNRIAALTAPGMGVLRTLWEQSLTWSGSAFPIWDLAAAVAVSHPEHFSWETGALDVIVETGNTHGQTIMRNAHNETSRYAYAADYDAVREAVFDILE